MKSVSTHEAKTHLSQLIRQVEKGQGVIILRGAAPVARLTAVASSPPVPTLGVDQGVFEVPEDFDDPLPDEVLVAFDDSR